MPRLLFVTCLAGVLGCNSHSAKTNDVVVPNTKSKPVEKTEKTKDLREFELRDGKSVTYNDLPDSKAPSPLVKGSLQVEGSFTIPREALGDDEGASRRHVVVAIYLTRDGMLGEFTSHTELSELNEKGENEFNIGVDKPAKPGSYEVVTFCHTTKNKVIVDRRKLNINGDGN